MAKSIGIKGVTGRYCTLLRTLALLACICASRALAAQITDSDREAWLRDYSALKQNLEQRYSNLAWFGSIEGGVDLPALDRQTIAALKAAENYEDARQALLTFVKSFHDGHFSQLGPPAPPGTATQKPTEPEYSPQDAAGGCTALGYGPVPSAAFSLPFDSLPGFELISDGTGYPFRAGILTAKEPRIRLGIVRIPEFESNYRTPCMDAWKRSDVWDQQGKLVRGALRRTIDQSWYATLADLIRKFKTAGVAAVLVDIGNNSGGGDSGDIAARLFTGLPLRSAELWMSQDQAASARYFDEQITALHHALELDHENKQVQESLDWFTQQKDRLTQPCPMDWVWREHRAWGSETCRRIIEAGSAGGPLAYLAPNTVTDLRVAQRLHWPAVVTPLAGTWTGPLYVLTDNKTYSAAEMFAAVLQNNRAARIVGTQTGGDGCGFMNSTKPLVLPTSGLRFRVPNCVRMRADGTDEVAGIKPDIPIAPKDEEAATAKAQRTLEQVYADLKRSSDGK